MRIGLKLVLRAFMLVLSFQGSNQDDVFHHVAPKNLANFDSSFDI